MRTTSSLWLRPLGCLALAGVLSSLWTAGCGTAAGSPYSLLGFPLFSNTEQPPATGLPGTGTGGGFFGGGVSTGDPCDEPLPRKFVTISMRNLATRDHIHYFLMMVAFINSEEYPDGGVCPDDVTLYENFGYTRIPAGTETRFGNFCIEGPALLYFHQAGRFRATGNRLASAIGPAQGTSATFDSFFSSAGAQVPVPDWIIFHNPGTGDGASLNVARKSSDPCSETAAPGAPICQQDAFYYVDQNDLRTGSTTLGAGSGRRIPSEIQGTGCECLGFEQPNQVLAGPTARSATARCNEFFRGGRIEYVFIRDDRTPPIPQLVWRVSDAAGGRVHDFDSRVTVP